MDLSDSIYVAGHRGLVGRAVVRCLARHGYAPPIVRDRAQLDLREEASVRAFFQAERPSYVVLAAAKVGGIVANSSFPADFIRDNLLIQTNVMDAARQAGVRKLLFLGSSCIYPKHAPQPIQEQSLLTGLLEPTNEAYAVAKIAGITMARAYRAQYGLDTVCAMPSNLYGPFDNFDLTTSHVLPALMRKMHEAKLRGDNEVHLWGTGAPRREFLHVDDLAEACLMLLRAESRYDLVNVGVGEDVTIREASEMMAKVVGFSGKLAWDTSKPDGTPRKLLDISRMSELGWQPRVSLWDGLTQTYEWFRQNVEPRA